MAQYAARERRIHTARTRRPGRLKGGPYDSSSRTIGMTFVPYSSRLFII
jgi:hypothetical protein